MKLVYFSSSSGNTERFCSNLKCPDGKIRIGYRSSDQTPIVTEPFILISPTYADGTGQYSVHKNVIKFLNCVTNRHNMRGVVGSGNINFGQFYAYAADVISAKCGVPILHRFELAGTQKDIDRINQLLSEEMTNV